MSTHVYQNLYGQRLCCTVDGFSRYFRQHTTTYPPLKILLAWLSLSQISLCYLAVQVPIGYTQGAQRTHKRWEAGPCLNIKTVFPGMGIPIIKIRWSHVVLPCYPCPYRLHTGSTSETQRESGPCLNIKTVFPGIGISIIKIRWSHVMLPCYPCPYRLYTGSISETQRREQRALSQYKDSLSRNRDFHCKDKMASCNATLLSMSLSAIYREHIAMIGDTEEGTKGPVSI